jgi:hypothetical protein
LSFLLFAALSVLAARAAAPRATPAAPTSAEPAAPPAAEVAPTAPPAAGVRVGRGPVSATTPARPAQNGVEVVAVHFLGAIHGSNSANMWNETEIEISVKPAATRGDSRYVNRVKVTLTLAHEDRTNMLQYYRASAEAVALMEGRAKIRFYLPPEIVRRDTLRAEPKLWAVDVVADGQAMAPARAASSLTTPAARADFLKKADAVATANAGILVPQYLTPFAFDNDRSAPAFVRSEALR